MLWLESQGDHQALPDVMHISQAGLAQNGRRSCCPEVVTWRVVITRIKPGYHGARGYRQNKNVVLSRHLTD
jgi:hypothetical protein